MRDASKRILKHRSRRKHPALYSQIERRFIRQKWIVFTALVAVNVLFISVTLNRQIVEVRAQRKQELAALQGPLIPGSEPTPPNVCPVVPNGAIRILLGPAAAFSGSPQSVVIDLDGEDLLTMYKDSDGSISVSADIFDRDHNEVAEIDHNVYTTGGGLVFSHPRRNRSNLRVILQKDKEEVLNVDYLNPQTVQITGVFRSKLGGELKVENDNIIFNGRDLGILHVCAGNARRSVFSFHTNEF